MQDSCQTDWNFWQDKIKFCRTGGLSVIKLLPFLPEITGHLSDKLKFSAGQNENLPVLSDSPAVFAKTKISPQFHWNITIISAKFRNYYDQIYHCNLNEISLIDLWYYSEISVIFLRNVIELSVIFKQIISLKFHRTSSEVSLNLFVILTCSQKAIYLSIILGKRWILDHP